MRIEAPKTWRGLAIAATVGFCAWASSAMAETTIRLATALPADSGLMKAVFQPWIDEVNAKADGVFRIVAYPPPFATGTNVWDRTRQGVADMGLIVIPATGLPFAGTNVATVPGSGSDIRPASAALWTLYEEGLLAGEYDDVHLMSLTAVPPLVFISTERIDRMEQLEGMRVRVNDQNGAAAMQALHATPVAMPFSEAYQGFARGVVTGGVANGITILNFRFGDVARNQIRNVEFGMPPSAIVMNKRFYEGLSDEAKAILDSVSGMAGSLDLAERQYAYDRENLERLEHTDGYTIVTLDDAERQRWLDAIGGVADQWAEATPNGRAILERYRAAYADAAARLYP